MQIVCPRCLGLIEVHDESAPPVVSCPACGSWVPWAGTDTLPYPPPDLTADVAPAPTGASEALPVPPAADAVDEDAPVRPGQTVSHYRIIERLGGGGMGVVYRARDARLGRGVAVKFLTARHARSPQALDRFRREARTASELNHPHICIVHDVGEYQGHPFIVMELLEGHTLHQILAGRPLPAATLIDLAEQIADALDAAHAKGIVHRDVKSANIFVTPRGRAKVLDFGLAKPRGEPPGPEEAAEPGPADPSGELSSPGAVMGTRGYMSPEQARGEEIDARSDVFSFGVVLYEMATGTRPVAMDEMASGTRPVPRTEDRGSALPRPPRPPRELNPDLPLAVERIILRALEPDRDVRYPTAAAVLADLRRVRRELARPPADTPPAPQPTPGVWHGLRWVGVPVAAALLAVATWAWWRDRPLPHPQPPGHDPGGGEVEPRVVPFTSFPGDEFNAAFSPDGRRIAFVWNGEAGDNYDVYVMPVGGTTPLRLTSHPDSDVGPAWSPDGRQIVFARYSGRGRQLLTVPAEGGEERVVATVGLGPADPSAPLAWSPDGRLVAYSDRLDSKETHGIFLLDLETRERRRLTAPSAPGYDTNPRFAPGGRLVAFARRTPTRVEDVYVVPIEGGEPVRLTQDGHSVRGLDWLPDGQGILFASNRSGPFRIWKVPLAGGIPVAIPGPDEQVSGPAVDPRGGRYACTKRVEDRNIWRVEIGGDRPAAATRLIASTRDEAMPHVSPLDRSIVFVSNRSGTEEIWRCAADGSGPKALTAFGGPAVGAPRWSPDGRHIAFDSRATRDSAIYMIAADGGPPRQVTVHPADDMTPSWSRDGRWIYFVSNRTGEREIWKVPAAGGDPARVTTGGGQAAFESADGTELYFWRGGERPGIWKMPAAGGPERLVHPDVRPHFWGSWAVGKGGLYFIQEETTADHTRKATIRSTVRYFDFASEQIRVLAALEKPTWGLALDPDERWVLFGQYDQRGSDIILVEANP